MWLKKWRINILRKFQLHMEYSLAVKCLFFSYIPLFFFFTIFQIFISKEGGVVNSRLNFLINYSPSYLLLYIGFGSAHIILSSVVIVHYIKTIWPKRLEFKKQLITILSLIIPINTLPVILTTWLSDPSLAWYSHERIYIILKKAKALKHFFNDNDLFHDFSLFPVTLILVGLLVQVFAAFNLGKIIYTFKKASKLYKDREKFQLDAQKYLKSIREIIRITSMIMVSSTICTLLFFLVPLQFISDKGFIKIYHETSVAVGIYWGIIFSLTLLFLGLWSFHCWSKIVNDVVKRKKFQADKNISKWLVEKSDLFSLVSNTQFSLSIASPLLMSVFSALVAKWV